MDSISGKIRLNKDQWMNFSKPRTVRNRVMGKRGIQGQSIKVSSIYLSGLQEKDYLNCGWGWGWVGSSGNQRGSEILTEEGMVNHSRT